MRISMAYVKGLTVLSMTLNYSNRPDTTLKDQLSYLQCKTFNGGGGVKII